MTLARIDPAQPRDWIGLLPAAAELAKSVAGTNFVPAPMRHDVPAITACILYGDEIGIGPMVSLAKISVIEGRPFVAAETLRALVLAAGHEIWPDVLTTNAVTMAGRRHGSDIISRVTFTMEDARRARIDGKPNWRMYPQPMLLARASALLCRATFPDVIGGLSAAEEFDDAFGTDIDPQPSQGAGMNVRQRRPRGPRKPQSPTAVAPAQIRPLLPGEPQPAADTAAEPSVERPAALAAEPEPERVSRGRLGTLHGTYRRKGIMDRAARRKMATEVVGREVPTSANLTPDEADKLLDHLRHLPDAADPDVDSPEPEPELPLGDDDA